MPMIDFGASNGSTDAGNAIRPYVNELFEIFYQNNEINDYFSGIEKFHIVFLVSGKNKDFGSEGAENLQKVRGRPVLLVYYAIPQNSWDSVGEKEFRKYLSLCVQESFKQLVEKAKKGNHICNEEMLLEDFKAGIALFEAGSSST